MKAITTKMNKIGNLVHDTVPVSKNEDDNRVERTWGEPNKMKITSKPGACHHHEVLMMIDGVDLKRGTKIAGHRGYYLKGPGCLLNMALL
jgi:seryl-tRNA synthetase